MDSNNGIFKNAMHDKRWDCSTLKYAPKFKRDLRKGTSERAFVHSLSSAAVGINVAKRCALGDLDKCGCNERPQDDHLDEKVSHFILDGLKFENF